MTTISSISDNLASLLSSSNSVTNLVSQYMALERKPINDLQTEKSDLNVRSAMFTDLKNALSGLKDASDDLTATGTSSTFESKTATSSDSSVLTATATGDASVSSYSIDVSCLAKAARISSDAQSSATTALGYTGSFYLNGATISAAGTDTLQNIRDSINAATFTSGQEVTASIVNNSLVLQTKATGASQEVVAYDVTGNTLSGLGVISLGASNLALGMTATASSTLDAGHPASNATNGLYGDANAWISGTPGTGWLQVDLGSSQTIDRVVWGRDEAGGSNDRVAQDYTIQVSTNGTDWTTVKTVTGHSFAAAGDDATDSFAATSARYVRMNVTATTDGLEPAIDEFQVYNDTHKNQLQTGQDASFTVDGISVSRSSNTAINDVIAGVSIDLKTTSASAVTLAVSHDTSALTGKISAMLNQLNSAVDYIKGKTAVTASGTTYTRGALAGEFLYVDLRRQLYSALTKVVSGVTAGNPASLAEIGITVDSSMHATISDSAKLQDAINSNADAVAFLFNSADGVASRIVNLVTPFTLTGGTIDDQIDSIKTQTTTIDSRVARLEDIMTQRQKELTDQFTTMQQMLYSLSEQQSTFNNYMQMIGLGG